MQLEAWGVKKIAQKRGLGLPAVGERANGSFLLWLLSKGLIKNFVGFIVLLALGTAFAPYQGKENKWSNVNREALWRVYH